MSLSSPIALWVVIVLAAGFGVVLVMARAAWKEQLDQAHDALGRVRAERQKLLGEIEQGQDATAKAVAEEEAARQALKAENERLVAELDVAQVEAFEAEERRQELEAKLEAERRELKNWAEAQRHETESRVEQLVRASGASQKELDDRARKLAMAQQDAKTKGEQLKKVQDELAEVRKGLIDAQAGAKKHADVQSELARAKQALTQAEARADKGRAEAAAARQEAAALADKVKTLEAELAAAAKAAQAGGAKDAAPAGVIAALEADPNLNRGQRETIRMMYDQFTRSVGKR